LCFYEIAVGSRRSGIALVGAIAIRSIEHLREPLPFDGACRTVAPNSRSERTNIETHYY
jgi:hypothetical protein